MQAGSEQINPASSQRAGRNPAEPVVVTLPGGSAALSATSRTADRVRTSVATLFETAKPGITRLVVITAAVGFVMTALTVPAWTIGSLAVALAATLVGTGFSAAGANALNMWFEKDRDRLMNRTAARPLPAGRASVSAVFWFGAACSLVGVGVLALGAGPVPALLSLLSIVSYVLVYTPLKVVTPWSTLVGALPGALPPLIGASAAATVGAGVGWASALDPLGMTIFWLMMVWQIPHFLAIAWIYRGDYQRGSICVLPTRDPSGAATAAVMFLTTALLLPATLAPAFLPVAGGVLGATYVTIATVLWIGFAGLVARWSMQRTDGRARAVFVGSIIHLPLLLIAMVIEGFVRVVLL